MTVAEWLHHINKTAKNKLSVHATQEAAKNISLITNNHPIPA